jgi:hypothetical protein
VDRSPRRPLRPLVATILVVTAGLAGLLVPAAPPSAGQVIIDVFSTTELAVAPGDRTQPGVELTLAATVTIGSEPVVGENVRFFVGGLLIATVTTDEAGQAQATVTPLQGAHTLSAEFPGGDDVIPGASVFPSSDRTSHSVLPDTCVDEAQPGAGAVVRHAYLVALRRCPDPAGYAYWVDRLEGGAASGMVASTLARSAEAVDVVVDDAYRRILGRPADAAGRAVWAAKLRAGWTTSQLWAALAASPEFGAGTDGPAALVERAFTRVVGRPADPGGATYWQARLVAGGPPSATWRALAVTAEVIDGIVGDAHDRALGRPATPAEGDAARTAIRTRRGDWRLLVAELLGRPEASTHAQRYPDPEVDD